MKINKTMRYVTPSVQTDGYCIGETRVAGLMIVAVRFNEWRMAGHHRVPRVNMTIAFTVMLNAVKHDSEKL